MNTSQLITAGYELASSTAVRAVLGLNEDAPDRKVRKALARHVPTSDDERQAAVSLSLVRAWLRSVGRAGGRRMDQAIAGLPKETWRELRDAALPAWSHQFAADYPQLQLDGDRLFARTVLNATTLDSGNGRDAQRRLAQRVQAALAGEIAPGAVGTAAEALELYGGVEAQTLLAQTVLGDADEDVVIQRRQLDREMAELAHTIEELRPHLQQAGIPHEHVIGPATD